MLRGGKIVRYVLTDSREALKAAGLRTRRCRPQSSLVETLALHGTRKSSPIPVRLALPGESRSGSTVDRPAAHTAADGASFGSDPETWAVMAGRGADRRGSPLNVPPVLASNFELGSGRAYSRDDATPTWEAFEELLGGLEGGEAVAFASGMGAAAAVFDLLPVGATVVLGDDCYQGVAGLAAAGAAQGRWRRGARRRRRHGALVELAADADLLWLESPSNPLLARRRPPTICAAPRKADALLVVDSTFATPLVAAAARAGRRPGHALGHEIPGRPLGPAARSRGRGVRRASAASCASAAQLAGATPGALEAFLAVRGMRTLPLRLQRASATAADLAERSPARRVASCATRRPDHPTHARRAAS